MLSAMQSALVHTPVAVQPFRGSHARAASPRFPCLRRSIALKITCQKDLELQKEQQPNMAVRFAKPVAAALAASLLLSAVVPEEALAARSGGRVGGSSFRSSAPRSAAPRSR
jgi:hypothetical protein